MCSEHIHYRLGVGDICYKEQLDNESGGYHQYEAKGGLGRKWKRLVDNGKEKERKEESLLIVIDYLMYSSIGKERRLLDEKRVK
jgi:hypothetical protein